MSDEKVAGERFCLYDTVALQAVLDRMAAQAATFLAGEADPLLLAATAYAGWDYWRVSQVYLPVGQRASWWREDPMAAARRSWLFAGAVRFAEVTTQPVTRADAAWMLAAADQSLHYSPEPRVITRLIEAASLLGRDDVALAHMARFRAAFPADYRTWTRDNARLLEGAQRPQPAASGASP